MSPKWVIIWLSIQLTILSFYVTKQAYELGYERGRASVYKEFAEDGIEGTCFAIKGDCHENKQSTRIGKRN